MKKLLLLSLLVLFSCSKDSEDSEPINNIIQGEQIIAVYKGFDNPITREKSTWINDVTNLDVNFQPNNAGWYWVFWIDTDPMTGQPKEYREYVEFKWEYNDDEIWFVQEDGPGGKLWQVTYDKDYDFYTMEIPKDNPLNGRPQNAIFFFKERV